MGKVENRTSTQYRQELQTSFLPLTDDQHPFNKSLDTNEYKKLLESVRDTGTSEQISQTELEIAKEIYTKSMSFPFGQSSLCEILLQEVNINYLMATNSKKTFNSPIIITADKTLVLFYSIAMSGLDNTRIITNDKIKVPREKPTITTSDIIAFAQEPNTTTRLTFNFMGSKLNIHKHQNIPKFQILWKLGQELNEKGYEQEVSIICHKLMNINNSPENPLFLSPDQQEIIIQFLKKVIGSKQNDDANSLVSEADNLIKMLKQDNPDQIITDNLPYLSQIQSRKNETEIDKAKKNKKKP